uniref:Syntaxin 6/10/61 N-terminal domain-containing protein n=1 Tax=Oryctolagus cuniculus TaxID=9986 RepID=A0A5F9CUS6_RABIT
MEGVGISGSLVNLEDHVQKAVNTAQGLFQRWTELLQDPSIATREEIDWTTNELRNNLRSIEWDLEDLDETINILLSLSLQSSH